MTQQKLIVHAVGARKYSFTDEKSGRQVEGVTVYHLQAQEGCVGLVPSKISFPFALGAKIGGFTFPGKFEVETTQIFGTKGVITKFVDLHPVK